MERKNSVGNVPRATVPMVNDVIAPAPGPNKEWPYVKLPGVLAKVCVYLCVYVCVYVCKTVMCGYVCICVDVFACGCMYVCMLLLYM